MSSERHCEFDATTNAFRQTVIANHFINEIKNCYPEGVNICFFTLTAGLSTLNVRYSKTVCDIIVEYDLVNPQTVKTMGSGANPPYSGIYKMDEKRVDFNLDEFPKSLIIILYQFSLLTRVEISKNDSRIKDRIRNNDLQFSLNGINLSECFARVNSIEKIMKVPGKTNHDIVLPGKSVLLNSSGATSRLLTRGLYLHSDGNPYSRETRKPCWWHRHQFEGKAVGIPIKAALIEGELKVYLDGIFCSYECAYAFLLEKLCIAFAYRNPMYKNSKELIKQMYDEEFPGKELRPAGDWTYLRDVGNGDLSLKDFTQKLSSYSMGINPNFSTESVAVSVYLNKINN